MISQIRTASRLHFGLLALPPGPEEPSSELKRFWGGIGLMIEQPGIELVVEPSEDWAAVGPSSERVLGFVEAFRNSHPENTELGPFQFRVRKSAPEHVGFGTGTQLGLATARLLAEYCDVADKSAVALAKLIGRGRRSAIGIHGFDVGGFLVEGGKTTSENISPLIARFDFPDDWRVILISPGEITPIHGTHEVQVFQELRSAYKQRMPTEDLCRLVLLGLLPSLGEQDCQAFGQALTEFNYTVGEIFARVQGGGYAHPMSEEIVQFVQTEGVAGIAQSSWGPTMAAITDSLEMAVFLKRRLEVRFPNLSSVEITKARNLGAEIA
ncbi:MAG: beta-ribofuranosylaminobenzene 5'-phosphate synthase family protein [Gemmataceae bacterium]